jgi:hypothetical protein
MVKEIFILAFVIVIRDLVLSFVNPKYKKSQKIAFILITMVGRGQAPLAFLLRPPPNRENQRHTHTNKIT